MCVCAATLLLMSGFATAQNKTGGSTKSPSKPDLTANTTANQTSADMIDRLGFDIFGIDLPAIRNLTFEQCRNACAESQDCLAVTYRQDLQRCYPKASAKLIVRNQKSDASILPGPLARVEELPFELFPQSDIPGFDLTNSKADDAQACLALCAADPACNAFAYATRNKMCYLKAQSGTPVDAPAIVAGQRSK
jgi:serine protease Do